MIGIYKIKNLINGKVYIGQSTNIEGRKKDHKRRIWNSNSSQYNSYLYRSIRKYGLDNFEFSVLEECLSKDLDNKESCWIKFYNSNNPEQGYNSTGEEIT